MSALPLTFYYDCTQGDDLLLEKMLQEFAAAGGENIVLNERMIEQIIDDPAYGRKLQKAFSAAGVSFLDAHAPMGDTLDFNSPWVEDFRFLVLRHKLHLNIAAAMGIKTMTFHVGNDHVCPNDPLQRQFERIFRIIEQLLPEAEKLNIVMCLENIWLPVNTAESLWQIKNNFSSDNLGFCYDSGHANIMGKGCQYDESVAHVYWRKSGRDRVEWDSDVLEKLLPQIVNCHLHDNDGSCDSHSLPGRGNVDWQAVIGKLKQAPRLQVFQSETVMQENDTAAVLVKTFQNLLKQRR